MNKKRLKNLSIFLLLFLTLLISISYLFQSGGDPSVNEDQISLEIIDIEENNDELKTIVIEIFNDSDYILTGNVLHLYSGTDKNNKVKTQETTTSSKENHNSGSSSSIEEEASKITTLEGVFNPLQPGTVAKVELSIPESIETEELKGLRFRNAYIIDVEDNQRYGNTLVKKVFTDF